MTLQGKHIEEVPSDSDTFIEMQKRFHDLPIMVLYKIAYHDFDGHRHEHDSNWEFPVFHGTSHCGCLTKRVSQDHYRLNLVDEAGDQDGNNSPSQGYPKIVSTPVDREDRQTTIASHEWCQNPDCETQGILNSGFLKSVSQSDDPSHHFTPSVELAVDRAATRGTLLYFSSIFVCEVDNSKIRPRESPLMLCVKEDCEITPCYFAIVLNTDTKPIRYIKALATIL